MAEQSKTIPRAAADIVRERLRESPAAALLGPRQVGKTTLARQLADAWPAGAVYLDLERPADVRRLADADSYLRSLPPRLAVIDEAQRLPELFPILRSVIDDNRRAGFDTGQLLLLGSAWLDLTMAASESLAGRVALTDLTGVAVDEAAAVGIDGRVAWLRGGFPRSLLAASDAASLRWRSDLVTSYLERDVAQFAPRAPAETLRRLWTMLAHGSGGLFNAARLAASLDVSGPTVSRYVDLLVDLGLVRRLEPWFANVGQRVVKSPKLYVRDSGLLHALLELETCHDLLGHPAAGASFEGFAVECLAAAAGRLRPYFFRTARGDEIDLVLTLGGQPRVAVEVKLSSAPVPGAGFFRAADALGVETRYLVHPDDGREPYQQHGLTVIGLGALTAALRAGRWAADPGGR
ncbi:MAG: ATP-binding protein [Propionibacteriaceae bacterium]|jgi:predicted AAA+ superfamily ATPase|nr:ATP-binding protein [Propionibacteriaceae bacterium]